MLALRVESHAQLMALKKRVEAAGVQVLGVTDHHICQSIYFFDPNGLRLEFTLPTQSADEAQEHRAHARAVLDGWTARAQS